MCSIVEKGLWFNGLYIRSMLGMQGLAFVPPLPPTRVKYAITCIHVAVLFCLGGGVGPGTNYPLRRAVNSRNRRAQSLMPDSYRHTQHRHSFAFVASRLLFMAMADRDHMPQRDSWNGTHARFYPEDTVAQALQ